MKRLHLITAPLVQRRQKSRSSGSDDTTHFFLKRSVLAGLRRTGSFCTREELFKSIDAQRHTGAPSSYLHTWIQTQLPHFAPSFWVIFFPSLPQPLKCTSKTSRRHPAGFLAATPPSSNLTAPLPTSLLCFPQPAQPTRHSSPSPAFLLRALNKIKSARRWTPQRNVHGSTSISARR